MTTYGKNLHPTTPSPTNLQKIFELFGLPIAVITWKSQIAQGDELFQLTPLFCWTYASINSKLQRPPQSFQFLKIVSFKYLPWGTTKLTTAKKIMSMTICS